MGGKVSEMYSVTQSNRTCVMLQGQDEPLSELCVETRPRSLLLLQLGD